MNNIFEEIRKEREYQKTRWGDETDDKVNTPWMWTAYITQYAGKWMAGTFMPLKGNVVDSFRKSMITVATLAVAAVESVDRQRKKNNTTFYEESNNG